MTQHLLMFYPLNGMGYPITRGTREHCRHHAAVFLTRRRFERCKIESRGNGKWAIKARATWLVTPSTCGFLELT